MTCISYFIVERPTTRHLAQLRPFIQLFIFAICCACLLVIVKLYDTPPHFFLKGGYAMAADEQSNLRKAELSSNIIGSSGKEPSFLLLGDSHAYALAGLLDDIGKQRGEGGRYFFYDGIMVNGFRVKSKNVWHDYERRLRSFIDGENYKTAFIAYRWTGSIKGNPPDETNGTMLERVAFVYDNGRKTLHGTEALEASLRDTLDFLKDNGLETAYIFMPTPDNHCNVPRMAQTLAIREGLDCKAINDRLAVPIGEYLERNSEAIAFLRHVAMEYDYVRLIDPTIALCPGGESCLPVDNGHSLYIDTNHLSRAGTEKLRPLVEQAIEHRANEIILGGD